MGDKGLMRAAGVLKCTKCSADILATGDTKSQEEHVWLKNDSSGVHPGF